MSTSDEDGSAFLPFFPVLADVFCFFDGLETSSSSEDEDGAFFLPAFEEVGPVFGPAFEARTFFGGAESVSSSDTVEWLS
jgi:hypothetical protein